MSIFVVREQMTDKLTYKYNEAAGCQDWQAKGVRMCTQSCIQLLPYFKQK